MSAKRAVSVAGILLLTGSLIVQPQMANGQGAPKVAPVEVTNTSANPVPTTLVPSGNTVRIGNNASAPIPTYGQEDVTRQSFSKSAGLAFQPGTSSGPFGVTCVDAGKRLIIEDVSAFAFVPPDQKVFANMLVSHGDISPPTFHYLTHFPQGTADSSTGVKEHFSATRHMHLYVDAGYCVSMFVSRTSDAGDGGYNATVAGYFVNVP